MSTTPAESERGAPDESGAFRFAARVRASSPYAPPSTGSTPDLHLDANEGPRALAHAGAAAQSSELLRRYPDAAALEAELARRARIGAARVLVTAGGDDAIDRVCRIALDEGDEFILPVPTFEMIRRSGRLAGGRCVSVPWAEGPYPRGLVIEAITERTRMIAVVSPNNPTGCVATAEDLAALARAAPGALLLVDLAYTEFAETDLTPAAMGIPSAVIVRTFSKAYGLAGLRVGYAIAEPPVIRAMRSVASPYPCSGVSIGAALEALHAGDEALAGIVERVRIERHELRRELTRLGARAIESQANFVLAHLPDAERVWRSLGESGIAVRFFAGATGLESALRITCPGDQHGFDRLIVALRAALPASTTASRSA